MQQCIKRITYHNQLGFIPGMQSWVNIQKLLHQETKEDKKNSFFF